MRADEIERFLAEERTIEPSPDFARRVMAALEPDRRRAEPRPLTFPWLTTGLAAATGLVVALVLVRQPALTAGARRLLAVLQRTQTAPFELALLTCAFTLLGLTLALSFWLARRES